MSYTHRSPQGLHGGYGYGYYGKREAEAEPGYGYGGHGSASVYVSQADHGYGYRPAYYNYGYNINGYGKRDAEAESVLRGPLVDPRKDVHTEEVASAFGDKAAFALQLLGKLYRRSERTKKGWCL